MVPKGTEECLFPAVLSGQGRSRSTGVCKFLINVFAMSLYYYCDPKS